MGETSSPSAFSRIEGLPIIIVTIAMILVFMVTAKNGTFLRPAIYTTMMAGIAPLILLALGLTFVIGAGEIDLSFPAIISFSGCIFAILFKEYDLGWFAVLAALAAGIGVGLVNGFLVAVVGIPSFIATLGSQFFFLGMATVISGGKSYALRGVEDSSVWQVLVGRFHFGGDDYAWFNQVSVQFVWVLAAAVLLWFILNRHRFGEHVLFIGDSNDVARVVGVNVAREKIKLFALMGGLAAAAALLLTLENKNFFGNQGQGYLLLAIAAVLIGGTSIFGGKATIVGTFAGCIIMWTLEAGLVASGLTGEWVRVVQGLVFLAAVVFYLTIEEPQRRAAFFARFRRHHDPGRTASAGDNPAPEAGAKTGPNPASGNL